MEACFYFWLTLLRCSSCSCFLFKASSSSSSLDRLLPSDPVSTVDRHKSVTRTFTSTQPNRPTTSNRKDTCFISTIWTWNASIQSLGCEMDGDFGCRAVRDTHRLNSNRWAGEHKCKTEMTRQKTEKKRRPLQYFSTPTWWWLHFNIHVRTWRSGKIYRRHDVQQTGQSGFEVSLSYLCPSHLWHYRVLLVQTVMCDGWQNETDGTLKQKLQMARKKKNKKKHTFVLCRVPDKTMEKEEMRIVATTWIESAHKILIWSHKVLI